MLQAARQLPGQAGMGNGDDALGVVLAEIADALQIGRDADRSHDFAQVSRHRLALGDGDDRLLADLALGLVKNGIVGDDLLGERQVGIDQGAHGFGHHLFGQAAHLGDAPGQVLQIFVIDGSNVRRHDCFSLRSQSGLEDYHPALMTGWRKRPQPKRPMM